MYLSTFGASIFAKSLEKNNHTTKMSVAAPKRNKGGGSVAEEKRGSDAVATKQANKPNTVLATKETNISTKATNISTAISRNSASPLASIVGTAERSMLFLVFLAFVIEIHLYHSTTGDFTPIQQQSVALTTENAFYYSFYDRFVAAPSVVSGFKDLLFDARTEFPDVINALERFNVWPEIGLGLVFRGIDGVQSIIGANSTHFCDPWSFFWLAIVCCNALGQAALVKIGVFSVRLLLRSAGLTVIRPGEQEREQEQKKIREGEQEEDDNNETDAVTSGTTTSAALPTLLQDGADAAGTATTNDQPIKRRTSSKDKFHVQLLDQFSTKITNINNNIISIPHIPPLLFQLSAEFFTVVLIWLNLFLNRSQTTRFIYMNSLVLREQWALPALWLQMLALMQVVTENDYKDNGNSKFNLSPSFLSYTFFFCVAWQFSPYVLVLQGSVVFLLYLLEQIPGATFDKIINSYLIGYLGAVCMMFCNELMLTSLFLSFLVAVKVLRFGEKILKNLKRSGEEKEVDSESNTNRSPLKSESLLKSLLLKPLQFLAKAFVKGSTAVLIFVFFRVSISYAISVLKPNSDADGHVSEIFCALAEKNMPARNSSNPMLPTALIGFFQRGVDRICGGQNGTFPERSFNARLYLVQAVFNRVDQETVRFFETIGTVNAARYAVVFVVFVVLMGFAMQILRRSTALSDSHFDSSQGYGSTTSTGTNTKRTMARQLLDGLKCLRLTCAYSDSSKTIRAAHDLTPLSLLVLQFALFYPLGLSISRLRVLFGPLMSVLAGLIPCLTVISVVFVMLVTIEAGFLVAFVGRVSGGQRTNEKNREDGEAGTVDNDSSSGKKPKAVNKNSKEHTVRKTQSKISASIAPLASTKSPSLFYTLLPSASLFAILTGILFQSAGTLMQPLLQKHFPCPRIVSPNKNRDRRANHDMSGGAENVVKLDGLCLSWGSEFHEQPADLLELSAFINKEIVNKDVNKESNRSTTKRISESQISSVVPFGVAASMSLSGQLRMFTNANLVIHPHYENERLRNRVQLMFSGIYHCLPLNYFAQWILREKLKARFIVVEYARCFETPFLVDNYYQKHQLFGEGELNGLGGVNSNTVTGESSSSVASVNGKAGNSKTDSKFRKSRVPRIPGSNCNLGTRRGRNRKDARDSEIHAKWEQFWQEWGAQKADTNSLTEEENLKLTHMLQKLEDDNDSRGLDSLDDDDDDLDGDVNDVDSVEAGSKGSNPNQGHRVYIDDRNEYDDQDLFCQSIIRAPEAFTMRFSNSAYGVYEVVGFGQESGNNNSKAEAMVKNHNGNHNDQTDSKRDSGSNENIGAVSNETKKSSRTNRSLITGHSVSQLTSAKFWGPKIEGVTQGVVSEAEESQSHNDNGESQNHNVILLQAQEHLRQLHRLLPLTDFVGVWQENSKIKERLGKVVSNARVNLIPQAFRSELSSKLTGMRKTWRDIIRKHGGQRGIVKKLGSLGSGGGLESGGVASKKGNESGRALKNESSENANDNPLQHWREIAKEVEIASLKIEIAIEYWIAKYHDNANNPSATRYYENAFALGDGRKGVFAPRVAIDWVMFTDLVLQDATKSLSTAKTVLSALTRHFAPLRAWVEQLVNGGRLAMTVLLADRLTKLSPLQTRKAKLSKFITKGSLTKLVESSDLKLESDSTRVQITSTVPFPNDKSSSFREESEDNTVYTGGNHQMSLQIPQHLWHLICELSASIGEKVNLQAGVSLFTTFHSVHPSHTCGEVNRKLFLNLIASSDDRTVKLDVQDDLQAMKFFREVLAAASEAQKPEAVSLAASDSSRKKSNIIIGSPEDIDTVDGNHEPGTFTDIIRNQYQKLFVGLGPEASTTSATSVIFSENHNSNSLLHTTLDTMLMPFHYCLRTVISTFLRLSGWRIGRDKESLNRVHHLMSDTQAAELTTAYGSSLRARMMDTTEPKVSFYGGDSIQAYPVRTRVELGLERAAVNRIGVATDGKLKRETIEIDDITDEMQNQMPTKNEARSAATAHTKKNIGKIEKRENHVKEAPESPSKSVNEDEEDADIDF